MTTSSPSVVDLTSIPETGRPCLLLFWAPWHEESGPGSPSDAVVSALASPSLLVARVNADDCSNLTEHYQVTAVPTFVLIDARGNVFDRIEGSQDLSKVARAVQALSAAPTTSSEDDSATAKQNNSPQQQPTLEQRLFTLTHSHPVMLFIKGTPDAPRCGFSKQAVQLLRDQHIAFGSFDILQDDDVRQGLKTFSDWPTYPQVYVNGELQGGLDILKELADGAARGEGSLATQLGLVTETSPTSTNSSHTTATTADATSVNKGVSKEISLDDQLKQLVHQQRIMLFMKGLPSAPQCGFSKTIVDLLRENGIHDFGAFDILSNDQVRQGLKKYSDWPTYPQLYCNGTLIGGLDIVQELAQDGSLKEALGE